MKNLILQKKFTDHNIKTFNFKKKFKSQILVEFNSWAPLQIANSYLLKCRVISYKRFYNLPNLSGCH